MKKLVAQWRSGRASRQLAIRDLMRWGRIVILAAALGAGLTLTQELALPAMSQDAVHRESGSVPKDRDTPDSKRNTFSKEEKDIWDIIAIASTMISSLILPVVLLYLGKVYSDRQKNREFELASIQADINRANLISALLDAIVESPEKKRQIALKAMSLALPTEIAQEIYAMIAQQDTDEKVRASAFEQFVGILSEYQRNCLRNMNSDKKFLFQRHTPHASVHQAEIRSLFSAGLITRKEGKHGFRSLFDARSDQEIGDHFQITERGRQVARMLDSI